MRRGRRSRRDALPAAGRCDSDFRLGSEAQYSPASGDHPQVTAESKCASYRIAFAASTSRSPLAVASNVPSCGRQPSFDKRNRLAELRDRCLADDRPGFCGRQEIHRQADGRRVDLALGHHEHRRTHGVVEHRREDAALDEAGGIAEIRLAVEAESEPAFRGPCVRTCQPSSFATGGMVMSSSTVLIIGTSMRPVLAEAC